MAYETADERRERIKGELRTRDLFALSLAYPRNLPSHYPSEQITADLKHLTGNVGLPWEIPDDALHWKDQTR
jgi:hypothetical protein